MRIVGCVDGAGRNVRDLARSEDAIVLADPLLGTTVDHVDDFLAVRVIVERMAMHRIHVGADEQELFAQVLAKAGEQVGCWLGAGIQKAMSQFNGAAESQPKQKEKQ